MEAGIYFGEIKPHPYYPEFYSPQPGFASERTLQLFVLQNYQRIHGLMHLKEPRLEYGHPSGRGPDLLFREKGSNAWVVIELENNSVDPVRIWAPSRSQRRCM